MPAAVCHASLVGLFTQARVVAVTNEGAVAADAIRLSLSALTAGDAAGGMRRGGSGIGSGSGGEGPTDGRGRPRAKAGEGIAECFDIDSVHHPEYRRRMEQLQQQRWSKLARQFSPPHGRTPIAGSREPWSPKEPWLPKRAPRDCIQKPNP